MTEAGCAEVESRLFDLFATMGATDDQLDFATVYASARSGVAHSDLAECQRLIREGGGTMSPLLDVLLDRVPKPPVRIARYCPPRHQMHFGPSFLELIGII